MKSNLFIDGTPISKIQDQVFVEMDKLIQPSPEGAGVFEIAKRQARIIGRVEGLGLAISILTGGDTDDQDSTD
jgi:hypothetical protein